MKNAHLMALAVMLAMLAAGPAQAAPPARPLRVPGDCTVTNINDSGSGSLRQCILGLQPGATITFSTSVFPPTSPATISLSIALPYIVTNNVTIDGSNAGVIVDGSNLSNGHGLVIDGASHVVIKGLQILNFPDDGIRIQNGATDNIIGGANGSPGGACSGDCNLISGNGDSPGDSGVKLSDSGTMSNTISGNYIGTDINGMAAMPNQSGVICWFGTQDNVIGGDTPGERNIISGNGGHGVALQNSGTMSNTVIGNYIGTNSLGTAALSNLASGLDVFNGAQFNHIGGNTPGERNLISGNGNAGIDIRDSDTTNNTVSGNYIGTDVNGTTAIANSWVGVSIKIGASHNLIGGNNSTPNGNCTGECNLISGNGDEGVAISGSGTMSNTISGNYIGTNASGTAVLGNTEEYGVGIYDASHNLIGGDTPSERNLISGNHGGVLMEGVATMSNTVSGNYIGTDASGTARLGNEHAVQIDGGVYNVIGGINATPGGTCSGECNLLSANEEWGVFLTDEAMNNTVSGNYIGTDVSGAMGLGNGDGIRIIHGSSHNLIGGDTPGRRNLISHNQEFGVEVNGNNSLYNTLQQNSIHTNAQKGIALTDGGNNNLPPPVITYGNLSLWVVSGTACAGCTIEVFSDAGNQGRVYEGNTTASAGGIWIFNKGSALTGPHTTATATDAQGNTSQFSKPFPSLATYLPLIFKSFDPSAIPPAPMLNPISNPDGDGNYIVSWTVVSGATDYTLQEDDNSVFSSPTTAYTGSGTSTSITGQAAGTYYYRVQTVKGSHLSSWSNIRSVIVSPPTGPDEGHYSGSSPSVSFDVSAGPQVCNYDISVPFGVATCHIQHSICATIIGNTFTITRADLDAIYTINGAFDTTVRASGNYTVSICGGTWILPPSTGTWSASKQ